MVALVRQSGWSRAGCDLWLWNIWDAAHWPRGGVRSGGRLAVGLATAYGIGWQVVEIDFSAFIENSERATLSAPPDAASRLR